MSSSAAANPKSPVSPSRDTRTPLTREAVDSLPGQLGIYEISDRDGAVVKIGYAGGLDPFGLRSALDAELADTGGADNDLHFRVECTHAYLTRSQELLMMHQARHGALPPGNHDLLAPLGRLSPGSVR